MWLHVINKVKVTHQCQGQINVKVKSRSFKGEMLLHGWFAFESNALLLVKRGHMVLVPRIHSAY